MANFLNAVTNFLKTTGTSVLEAAAILLFGIVVIKIATRILTSLFYRTKIEGSAASFIVSVIEAALALVLFFTVLKLLNIDTTSVLAVVAASGLAVGLALQDSLSNVASGIILLFTKPFKEGDAVQIGSAEGKVKRMRINNVELLTADNTLILVPNKKVVNSEIVNFSDRPTRRLDLAVPVYHGVDLDRAKALILDIVGADERIHTAPAPAVYVASVGEKSAEFAVKFWLDTADYWNVKFDFFDKVLKAFKENGIDFFKTFLNVNIEKEGSADA